MIEVASTPPTTTVADIPTGQAFQSIGVSPPIAYVKIAGAANGENAVNLANGQASVQAPTQVVTPAPLANFTLFPTP